MKRIRNLKLKLYGIVLCSGILTAIYVFRFPCPIKAVTGIPCPGCGMTHAWLDVLKIDFRGAFSENAAFWIIPLAFLLLLCDGAVFNKKALNTAFVLLLAFASCVSYALNLFRFFTPMAV